LTAFNIPVAVFPPIQTKLTTFEAAFATASDPNRGKVDVLNKNEARDSLKTDIRAFVKAYLGL
jgi:hypothetical protein